MSQILKRLLTNMSKGEFGPLIEGRPDLAAYFEGGSVIENFNIMRQGGLDRRVGTRFEAEVQFSTKDTIMLPFEASVNDSYEIEVGDGYMRFFKNKLPILSGGLPYTIVSPYTEAQLRNIHFTQSVDVLFLFHPDVQQRKLSRLSDTNWTLNLQVANPPPSFEIDTDVSAGGTLTPGATTGTGVTFTSSTGIFLAADAKRQVIFGTSRANITSITDASHCVADIIDAFPDTNPIPTGSWKLRLAPQTTLDPTIKAPVGALLNLTAGIGAFRAEDVGKFITIYAGLVKILSVSSTVLITAEIMTEMTGTTATDPPAAPAGAWTLEVASWSATNGFPRTGEFIQGRLVEASTIGQRTGMWLSESDDFDGFAVGIVPSLAIEYTLASRSLNRIEWLADNRDIFIGTSGSEHIMTSGKTDEPFGGDKVPLVTRMTVNGCAPIQPVVITRRVIYVDRSTRKIFVQIFDFQEDGFDALELTTGAHHICGTTGIRLGPIGYAKRPDPRLYFIRNDGTLVTLTYNQREKVIGFTRIVTDGTFEAVAVTPQPDGSPDRVTVIVKRTINGVVKRYVEYFETEVTELANRAWTCLETDCAKVYNFGGTPTSVLTGLGYLEGKTVDVVSDSSYRGTKIVSGGQITLDKPATLYAEVGLHYDSTFTTMRPAIEGQIVEGLPRQWIKLWARLYKTIGGLINGQRLMYPAGQLDSSRMLVGPADIDVTGYATEDIIGKITIKQDQPYPMTIMSVFGDIKFGDHG